MKETSDIINEKGTESKANGPKDKGKKDGSKRTKYMIIALIVCLLLLGPYNYYSCWVYSTIQDLRTQEAYKDKIYPLYNDFLVSFASGAVQLVVMHTIQEMLKPIFKKLRKVDTTETAEYE